MPWRHHVSVHCDLDIWVPFQPMAVLLGQIGSHSAPFLGEFGGDGTSWCKLGGYVIVYPSLARI